MTEEALARDDGSLSRAVAALRARDVDFAVDDMGAGYSGWARSRRSACATSGSTAGSSPGSTPTAPAARSFAAMQGYADSTGSLLVAEGVETEAELSVLEDIGVPLVLGFLLRRPVPPWPSVRAAWPALTA